MDKCYLRFVEGYLNCTYNHKTDDKCLMDDRLNNIHDNPDWCCLNCDNNERHNLHLICQND